jgi:hypothetical protein
MTTLADVELQERLMAVHPERIHGKVVAFRSMGYNYELESVSACGCATWRATNGNAAYFDDCAPLMDFHPGPIVRIWERAR